MRQLHYKDQLKTIKEKLTFSIKEFSESQSLLCHIEGIVEVMERIGFRKFLKLNEIRTMLVDEGIEGESIAPRSGKVAYIHIVISGCLHLTPEEQGIFGGLGLLALGLFNRNVLNLKHGKGMAVIFLSIIWCAFLGSSNEPGSEG